MLQVMEPVFAGFGPWVFAWFAGLERDNSRAYFAASRDRFEREVRGGVEALLEELGAEFGGEVRVFRQQRDVRFSADKSPYKTRTYGVLAGPDLYAEVSARGLYGGRGYPRLAADQLERYRAAVAGDGGAGEELADLVADARVGGLEVVGEALKTAPRGVPRDHPRVALLRHKGLIAGARLAPGDAGIARAAALGWVAEGWRAAAPLVAWLDAHVGPSTLPPEPGRQRRRR
jgi:uncharacterized protein (TIGR02453 family)